MEVDVSVYRFGKIPQKEFNSLVEKSKTDKKIFDKLVEDNMALVGSIVKKYRNRINLKGDGIEEEDIKQIGAMGLIAALRNFNTNLDYSFSTYAFPVIEGLIKRYFRDNGSLIKISRDLKQLCFKIDTIEKKFFRKYGREYKNMQELSDFCKIPKEQLEEAKKARMAIFNTTLESIIKTGVDGTRVTVKEVLPDSKDQYENIINKISIEEAFKYLTDREKLIINERYFNDISQTKLSKMLGVSQPQVSRAERKTLNTLKKLLS